MRFPAVPRNIILEAFIICCARIQTQSWVHSGEGRMACKPSYGAYRVPEMEELVLLWGVGDQQEDRSFVWALKVDCQVQWWPGTTEFILICP